VVSDTSQGEGWWIASDGKWYPPSAAPAASEVAPPPVASPPPSLGNPPAYGGPPQAYGGPPQAYGTPNPPMTQTSGKATAVMVLGIVSVVLMCGYGIGLIPAIVALVLAPGARREIEASGGRLQGEGQIKAGVICSWVAVGVVALGVLAIVAIVLISAIGSSSS
jgi:hypothetical protein